MDMMDKEEFKRKLSSYELNLPYPFSCFPGPERRKFALMFMIAGEGMKKQREREVLDLRKEIVNEV